MLITVDTGGTKTLIAGFDLSGKPKSEIRFATPKNTDEYITTLKAHLQETFSQTEISGIIIGVPGIVKDNIAVWCVNLGWENFDIAAALRPQFSVPIWLENDANLAGLAETRALDPIPADCLYVTISTGIGTGIIVNGNIEPALSSSEGGHMLLEYDGILREWELFASGRAIRETYNKYARDISDAATWEHITEKISRGFLVLIPILQPDVVVIGGSIGTYFARYAPILTKLLQEKLPPHIPCPVFQQAVHPEEAVIYGCYYYGTQKLTS